MNEHPFFGPHSRIQGNKVFVSPQNLFMPPPPPSHAILALGLVRGAHIRVIAPTGKTAYLGVISQR